MQSACRTNLAPECLRMDRIARFTSSLSLSPSNPLSYAHPAWCIRVYTCVPEVLKDTRADTEYSGAGGERARVNVPRGRESRFFPSSLIFCARSASISSPYPRAFFLPHPLLILSLSRWGSPLSLFSLLPCIIPVTRRSRIPCARRNTRHSLWAFCIKETRYSRKDLESNARSNATEDFYRVCKTEFSSPTYCGRERKKGEKWNGWSRFDKRDDVFSSFLTRLRVYHLWTERDRFNVDGYCARFISSTSFFLSFFFFLSRWAECEPSWSSFFEDRITETHRRPIRLLYSTLSPSWVARPDIPYGRD